jgi:hypothetical protein
MRKSFVSLAAVFTILVLSSPAPASDPPKASTASAPALTADEAARFAAFKRLTAPDPTMTVVAEVNPVLKPSAIRKQISCGVYALNPSNPYYPSPFLYFVNNTGGSLPKGVHIEWHVEGYPGSCCRGVAGPVHSRWEANPPTPAFYYTQAPLLNPPQPMTRPCKAWAILP